MKKLVYLSLITMTCAVHAMRVGPSHASESPLNSPEMSEMPSPVPASPFMKIGPSQRKSIIHIINKTNQMIAPVKVEAAVSGLVGGHIATLLAYAETSINSMDTVSLDTSDFKYLDRNKEIDLDTLFPNPIEINIFVKKIFVVTNELPIYDTANYFVIIHKNGRYAVEAKDIR